MFLTKKHLSRRTVLKGAGVALSLPLLDAMIPASTAFANTAAAVNWPRYQHRNAVNSIVMKSVSDRPTTAKKINGG